MTTYLATGRSKGIFSINDQSTVKGLGIHKAEWSHDATCDWLRSRNSPIILSSPGSRDTSANNSIFRDSLEVYKQNNRINHSNTFIDVFIYLKDWWGCVKWWHFYAFFFRAFYFQYNYQKGKTKEEERRSRFALSQLKYGQIQWPVSWDTFSFLRGWTVTRRL